MVRTKFTSVFPSSSCFIQIFSVFFLALFFFLQLLLCFCNSFPYFIFISFLFVIGCSCLMLLFMASSQSIAATNTVASRMCCSVGFASISYFHNLPRVLTRKIDMLPVTPSKPITMTPPIH